MDLLIAADVTGTAEQLAGIRRRLDDGRGLLQQCGLLLEEYERDVFATRGRGQWASLDSDTVELKGSTRVLVDTGNLLKNLTSAKVEGESVVVNQGDAYYGRFLRDGERGMPRRDPAPEPSGSVRETWSEQLLGYLVDGRW